MLLLPLGESDLIGASCHYLNIGGTGIVLDAGQSPADDGPDGLPRFEALENDPDWVVDHVILTHAHHDHIGSLPHLVRKFPHVSVHMTDPTRILLDTLLPASARLQARKAKERGFSNGPLFTEEELDAVTYLFRSYDLGEEFDLTGLLSESNVRGSFYHAGHVLGAAGALIEFEEGGVNRRLFYTSDTNLQDQTIHPGGHYPEPPIDVLVLETTLGSDPDIEKLSRRDEEARLGIAISEVIKRGGRVLLPVFALGRAQEVVALLARFQEQGLIDEDIPIYTTGLMRGISDIYDKTRFSSPRLDEDFEVYGVPQRRMPRSKAATAAAVGEPSIHIASSGMMIDNTLSNALARKFMGDPASGIFFVGFMKEDAPGYRLIEGAETGQDISLGAGHDAEPVLCDIARFRLSGHANRRDLLSLVDRLKPKSVALVHGETDAREWMADNIRFFHPDTKVSLPDQGGPIEL